MWISFIVFFGGEGGVLGFFPFTYLLFDFFLAFWRIVFLVLFFFLKDFPFISTSFNDVYDF